MGDDLGNEVSEDWVARELAEYPPWLTAEDLLFAYARLGRIFHLAPTELAAPQRFGEELTSSSNSFFKANELRRVLYDVEDVTQEFGSAVAMPRHQAGTVRGYCLLLAKARRLCEKDGETLQRILQPV